MITNPVENTNISPPDVALDPALNYQKLRSVGLQAIIDAGSNNWTDYNEHDPGITILETLIYSLTDLGYRTDFSINDILAQQKLSNEALAKYQFYTARNILTTNPVTFNDLRKIIIDQEGVGNSWIQIAADELNPISGLIEILIDPFPEIKNKEQQKKIQEAIESVYYRHRNLGQDLVNVVFRKPLEIIVDLEIVINPTAIAEEILAQVLFAIEKYLSSTVNFLTLQEMSDLVDGDANQIFDGPPLVHGFLPNEALLDYREELRAVDIIPILQDVPDVVVTNLLFQTLKLKESEQNNKYSKGAAGKSSSYWFSKLPLSKEEKPQLAKLNNLMLKVRKGKTPAKINQVKLAFELNKLKNQQPKSKLAVQDRDFPIPIGDFRDMETYFSIQQEFPQIYGLEPLGPPPNASETQLAQIKQLKAYLLVFDQIMANYLAQLSNLGQLFSWDKKITKTYFSQGLESAVSKLENLLVSDTLTLTTSSSDNAVAKSGNNLIIEKYKEKITEFREDEKTFLSRRNRFLNHLLSRFGRDLSNYTESINKPTLEAQEKIGIETKLRVLNQYSILSAQRARGFNLHRPEFPKEYSGLRQWVEAVFDMTPESIEAFHFNKRFAKGSFDAAKNNWDAFSEYILVTEDGSVDVKEIMRIGGDTNNYKTEYKKKLTDKKIDKEHHIVLYKPPKENEQSKVYRLVETFEEGEQALTAIDNLAALIKKYDQTSERIYIVEHTLLRPEANESYFGLELLDKNGKPWMKTISWYAKNALHQIREAPGEKEFYYCIDGNEKKKCLKKKKGKKIDPTTGKKVMIEWTAKFTFSLLEDPDSKYPYKVQLQFGKTRKVVKLISTDSFATEAIAVKAIKKWTKQLKSYHKQKADAKPPTPWKSVIKPWKGKPKNKIFKPVFKNPYSFILTVVLPDWPSRFQEKGFKKAIEKELSNECPAHLLLNIIWLEKTAFQEFQRTFSLWWEAFMGKEPDAYMYRADLMDFIMRQSFPVKRTKIKNELSK